MRGGHVQRLLDAQDVMRLVYTWINDVKQDVNDDPRVRKDIKDKVKAAHRSAINMSADLEVLNTELRGF